MMRIRPLLTLILLAGLAACSEEKVATHTAPGAPVIVISIDTLRADHLPAYGYEGVQTPALDALREDAILFTNAYSHAPLTLPSHASLLTGLLPQEHGVRNNIGYRLDASTPTIASMLGAAGYESGAAVSAYVLRSATGIGSGFDFFDDGILNQTNVPLGALQRGGMETAAIARAWISERRQKPFFFLLHLFEPHSPYEPPESYRSRYANPYDGEIAHVDRIVGEFLASLKNDGVYDKALIVVLSDHGEGLNQHGEAEHGIFLYREVIRVPLFVKLPGNARAGETVERAVGLVDVMPAIAEVTGGKLPPQTSGRSLLAPAPPEPRRIYSETLYPRIHLGWSELRSLAGEEYHYIHGPKPELYNLQSDPAETQNVLTDNRRIYASMRSEIEKLGSTVDVPVSIDPEEAKKLAALGYLGSTVDASSGPLPDPKDGMRELAALMSAMRLAQSGDHRAAVAEYRRLLAERPLLADAWNQLGTSLEALGELEDAAAAYRKAIELTPALAGEYALRLATVLLRLGKLDDAAAHAKLGEKDDYGGAHLLLARIELEREHYDRAEQEARLALEGDHHAIQARVLLGRIFAQQDRAREALAMVQEAAAEAERRKSGPVESLYFVTGDALARMQQYGPAERALRREIEFFPKNQRAYSSLYLIYMLTNRPAEARRALESMVQANPGSAPFAAQTAAAVGDEELAAQWRSR